MIESLYNFLFVFCLSAFFVLLKNYRAKNRLTFVLLLFFSINGWVFSLMVLFFDYFDFNPLLVGRFAYISGAGVFTFSLCYFASIFSFKKYYYINLFFLLLISIIFLTNYGLVDVYIENGKLLKELGDAYYLYVIFIFLQLLQIIFMYIYVKIKKIFLGFEQYRSFFTVLFMSASIVLTTNVVLPLVFKGSMTNILGPFFSFFVVLSFLVFIFRYHYNSQNLYVYELFLFFSFISLIDILIFDTFYKIIFLVFFFVGVVYILKLARRVERSNNLSVTLLNQNRLLIYFFQHQFKNLLTKSRFINQVDFNALKTYFDVFDDFIFDISDFEPEDVGLSDMISRSKNLFSLIFDGDFFEVDVELGNFVVKVDRVLMMHVFFNLIHNAFLHSRGDRLRIYTRSFSDGFLLIFADNGVGFSDDLLVRVNRMGFEKSFFTSSSGIFLTKKICLMNDVDLIIANNSGAEVRLFFKKGLKK